MANLLRSYRTIFILVIGLSVIVLLMNEYVFGILPEFNFKSLHYLQRALENGIQNSSSLEVIRALFTENLIRLPNLTLPSPAPSFIPISKVTLGLSYKDLNETVRTYYNKTIQAPGIVLKWKGRLGNQLFLYACHYALAKDLGIPLYISMQESELLKVKSEPRWFVLDKFQIPLDNFVDNSTKMDNLSEISDQDLMENQFLLRFGNDLHKRFISLDGESYCQSLEYWTDYQDDIRSLFEPREEVLRLWKLEPILKRIRESESVALHVRRGDFLKYRFMVPISFQRRAVWKMVKLLKEKYNVKPVFFVFSDDIDYAAEKLKDFEKLYELVYVSELWKNDSSMFTAFKEFYLMSQSKHNIFPSSTFGWWAGFLNKNKRKIVITSAFTDGFFQHLRNKESPARFNFSRKQFGSLFHPKEWIVLNPFTGGLEVEK